MDHSSRTSPNPLGAPQSLDRKNGRGEAYEERLLIAAIKAAREKWGNDNPLLKQALAQLRSNEKRRAQVAGPDELALLAVREKPWLTPEEWAGHLYQNRHAKALRNGGSHTKKDIEAQYARQGGTCFYCGAAVGGKFHVDHVVPISRGGSDGPENLVIACPLCNRRKGAKHPAEFAGIMF